MRQTGRAGVARHLPQARKPWTNLDDEHRLRHSGRQAQGGDAAQAVDACLLEAHVGPRKQAGGGIAVAPACSSGGRRWRAVAAWPRASAEPQPAGWLTDQTSALHRTPRAHGNGLKGSGAAHAGRWSQTDGAAAPQPSHRTLQLLGDTQERADFGLRQQQLHQVFPACVHPHTEFAGFSMSEERW